MVIMGNVHGQVVEIILDALNVVNVLLLERSRMEHTNSDLISREALLEAISNTWEEASPLSIIIIIANAPTINSLQNLKTQDEDVARVQWDQSVEFNPNLTEDLPIGTRLYTKEYVDKKVADALEEVAKICDDLEYKNNRFDCAGCGDAIRALIKGNAKDGE